MIEPAHVAATRSAWDTVAASYSEALRDHLAGSVWDRAMLDAFASLVPPGRIGDLGCGPGRIAGYLAGRGLDVFGIDLAPGMIEVARREWPGLEFSVGSLLALDLPDGALAGALVWYSLIHLPPAELTVAVAELARVVAVGGYLAVAFQVGDEVRHVTSGYGHTFVSVDAYRFPPDRIADLLRGAGFAVTAQLVREGEGSLEPAPQCTLLARRL